MPPPDKPVATHTTDERIDWLMLRFEEFKDWQGRVDRRLGQMEEIVVSQKDNTILLQKMLLLLQGQRDPGLEVPGLTDKVKALDGRVDVLTEWKNRMTWTAIGWGLGAGAGGTGIVWGLIKLLSK